MVSNYAESSDNVYEPELGDWINVACNLILFEEI